MIILGDWHMDCRLGNIRGKDLIEEKKEKLIELINKQDMVVFLGDYFNVPEPGNEYRHFFSNFIQKITIPKRFILGNHDIDNETSQNSLVAIQPFLNQNEIVSTYEEIGDICLVSYMFDYDKLEKIISNTKCKYVFGHFSFDYEMYGKLLKGELEYKSKYDNKQFILGHIHRYQIAKPNVVYLGSMIPTKLDELEYDFHIAIINEGIVEYKRVKHNIKQKVIKKVSDLEGIDDRTKIIIDIDDVEEKKKIMAQLKNKKILSIKNVDKKTNVDIGDLNLNGLLKEYLKTLGREDLYDKITSFIETDNIDVLLEEQ